MRGTTRFWMVTTAVAMLGGVALTAGATEVRTLQLSTSGENTRAVFEVAGPLDYRLFTIQNPDRIVLDLHATAFAPGFAAPAGKGVLKSIRTGKQGKGDVRVVFDLTGAVRPKSFLQAATDSQPARLIVDLQP